MSIRLRLSLLYSAILALTLAVVGVVLYTSQSQSSLDWLKQDLVVSSETLSQSIIKNYIGPNQPGNGQPGNPPPGTNNPQGNPPPGNSGQPGNPPPAGSGQPANPPPAGGGPGQSPVASPTPAPTQTPTPAASGTQTASSTPALTFSDEQTLQEQSVQEVVRVLEPSGKVIASPFGTTEMDLPLSASGLSALRAQQSLWDTQTIAGRRLLIYSRPVVFQGKVVAILQVARALTERDQSLLALGRTLLIATLAAILAGIGMGWLLARETLRPVQRIAQTAQTIGRERDFTRRVAYRGPQDEVGQLAHTFNSMLAQLEDAYLKVARALEMQRNFVADVSHELRTPLTTLRGNLGLLARKPPLPPADQADVIQDMVEESDRLIRLVNELLTLARAEAGRSLAHASVELQPLFEEVVRQGHQLAPTRAIGCDVPADLSATGDRDALKQVLLILVDNAIKHTAGAIELSARPDSTGVTLCVRDHGAGIPPDQAARIFERFIRGGDGSTPGLGLGLPIARALTEGQGGTLRLESVPGEGSAFLIHLSEE